jgi:uncharacterized membrane protein YgcG
MVSLYMAPLDFVTHFASALALALLVVWSGWPRHAAAGVALRKRTSEARRYFQAQLRAPHPQLDDAWYPYLFALGLSPELDAWFAAFGDEPEPEERKQPKERSTAGSSSTFGSTSASGTDGTEPARYRGGGGRFGGGGASGSWGSAAAEFGAGVSTPSSSPSSSAASSRSSSGSSSSSTSRSGGGSGGGC